MRTELYFRSLSAELEAVRDRVRHLIDGAHWLTDGEWKESVLRSAIRRNSPNAVSVGRGFVLTSAGPSSQIDILIHDNSHPVIYRDGDLVFVAPAACLAIIEVKSSLTIAKFKVATKNLADTAEKIRGSRGGRRVLTGLFAYECKGIEPKRALNVIADIANESSHRVLDLAALGSGLFVKWWEHGHGDLDTNHRQWCAYNLPSQAAGYFLHSLLMHLSPSAERAEDGMWFPENTFDTNAQCSRALRVA